MPGFQSFVISSNGSVTTTQTTPTTRTFGAYTVTVANSGTPGYNDRLRTGPANSGAFTESLLLRDFVFSLEATGTSGLDVTISNLAASTTYRVTLWSFDVSSATNRASDWSANGMSVTNNYAFNGNVAPTTDSQYRFSFTANTTPEGTMTISGRRNPASVGPSGAADLGVFLNALRIEDDSDQPPLVTIDPLPVTIFAGDNPIFTVGHSGTAPFDYRWFKNETNLVAGAATPVLLLSNAQVADAGLYSLVISNSAGSVTSAPAALTVHAVTNISAGLIAYWPLEFIPPPDMSGNQHSLFSTNMDLSNLSAAQPPRSAAGSAAIFNGTDEFMVRTNVTGDKLPASTYPGYSIAMWVKGNSVGQQDRRVFAESSDQSNNPLLTIGTDSSTNQASVVDILIRNNDGSSPVAHRRSSLPAFDGNWHHIVWVDNNGLAQLYVDGVQDTNNFNYTRGLLTPNITALGAVSRTNTVAFFNGQIDDVAVYRRSLTSNEVRYVMNYGPLPVPSQFIFIGVVSSNVTLRFRPEPQFPYRIMEATEFAHPVSATVWNEVTNAVKTVEGDTVTAEFPQPPGPQRFYIIERD